MAQQSRDRTGQQFGNYQLMRLLGEGGFAEVYLGEHVFLKTQAAIKILRTQLTRDEQEGFLQEARTIAHLTHPHIIRVFDFGMQGDLPYLVMDYAPNGSLRDRHPRGTSLAIETVLAYVKQVASALQYAHDQKVVHRDVKPENMLVSRNNDVLLGDFGISVMAQSTHSQRTHDVVGSAPYMAPEQLQGKPRPASDQYALGIVVYEWLSGERPFKGSFTEVYAQHMFSPPPPLRTNNPVLSAAIEPVIMIALAKDPHQRFASIGAFANALEQAARSSQVLAQTQPTQPSSPSQTTQMAVAPSSMPTVVAAPPSPAPAALLSPPPKERAATGQRISRRTILAGLGALVIFGGGIAWYELAHLYPPQGKQIYVYPGHSDVVTTVAWHDGTRIASGGNDNTVQVWDAMTGGTPHVYRNHNGKVNAVAWSPDGQSIVSGSSDGTAQVWNAAATTAAVTYKDPSNAFGTIYTVAWSPDGQNIVSGDNAGVVQVWNAVNGKIVYTYTGHSSNGFGSSVLSVAWSPDGTRIASGSGDNTVQVWDALTGKNVYIYKGHQSAVNAVAWSPDGTQIASGSDDKTVQVWKPFTQGTVVYSGHADAVTSVAWSPDGQYLASASHDKTVRVWKANSPSASAYIYHGHTESVNAVAWADDSHRLASGSDDKTVQVWEGV